MAAAYLGDASLQDAKALFLTYDNGEISNQKIPTLEEFLLAIKGKIMVKFDLKSGTFSTPTLIEIMQLAVTTDTTEQVLIRGGANLMTVAAENNFDTRMIMRKFDSAPTVSEINATLAGPLIRAISIPNGAPPEVIMAAKNGGLVVEVHESQGVSNEQRGLDWQAAIDNGVRQFHSFKPSLLLKYLEENDYREF